MAICFQAREILTRPHDRALNPKGLTLQAVVFGLPAFLWIGRFRFPYVGGFPWEYMTTWYELVGWATVDTGIFALGQAILLLIISRHRASDDGATPRETEPLLHA
jgi:hypothetical protein